MRKIMKWAACLTILVATVGMTACSEGGDTPYYNIGDFVDGSYGKEQICNGNYKGTWYIGQEYAGTATMTVTADSIKIMPMPVDRLLYATAGIGAIDIVAVNLYTGYGQYGCSETTGYYYITSKDCMFNAMKDGQMCVVKLVFEDAADNMSQAVYSRDTFVVKLKVKRIDINGEETVTFSPSVMLTFTAKRV